MKRRTVLFILIVMATTCVPSFPQQPPATPSRAGTETNPSLGFNKGKGVSGILDEDAYQEELEMAKRFPGDETVYTGRVMREAELLRQFAEGFQNSRECNGISFDLKPDLKPEFTLTIVVSARHKNPEDQTWTWAFSERRGMGGFGIQSTAKLTARDVCLTVWENIDANHFKKAGGKTQ